MPRYLVVADVVETHRVTYEIECDTPEEAQELVEDGHGDEQDRDFLSTDSTDALKVVDDETGATVLDLEVDEEDAASPAEITAMFEDYGGEG